MAGEIFISYRRADEAWARLLHTQLRAEGVEAWYDAQIGAGQDWRTATAKALQTSRIFVLLFSKAAAESDDIAKELAAATFSKKLVVPVRIENIEPDGRVSLRTGLAQLGQCLREYRGQASRIGEEPRRTGQGRGRR